MMKIIEIHVKMIDNTDDKEYIEEIAEEIKDWIYDQDYVDCEDVTFEIKKNDKLL